MLIRFGLGFLIAFLFGLVWPVTVWLQTGWGKPEFIGYQFLLHNLTFTICHLITFPLAAGLLCAVLHFHTLRSRALIKPILAFILILILAFVMANAANLGKFAAARPHPVEFTPPIIDVRNNLEDAWSVLAASADKDKGLHADQLPVQNLQKEWNALIDDGKEMSQPVVELCYFYSGLNSGLWPLPPVVSAPLSALSLGAIRTGSPQLIRICDFVVARDMYRHATPPVSFLDSFWPTPKAPKPNWIPLATALETLFFIVLVVGYVWYLMTGGFPPHARSPSILIFALLWLWIPCRIYADWHQNHVLVPSLNVWDSVQTLHLLVIPLAFLVLGVLLFRLFAIRDIGPILLVAGGLLIAVLELFVPGSTRMIANKLTGADLSGLLAFGALAWVILAWLCWQSLGVPFFRWPGGPGP